MCHKYAELRIKYFSSWLLMLQFSSAIEDKFSKPTKNYVLLVLDPVHPNMLIIIRSEKNNFELKSKEFSSKNVRVPLKKIVASGLS